MSLITQIYQNFDVKVKNTQLLFFHILFYCLRIMDFADNPLYLH